MFVKGIKSCSGCIESQHWKCCGASPCCKGTSILDCRMKTAPWLFSGCLDDIKKGGKSYSPLPLLFPINHKNSHKKPQGCCFSLPSQFQQAPQAECLWVPQGWYFLTQEAASRLFLPVYQLQGRNNIAQWARRCPKNGSQQRVVVSSECPAPTASPGWEPGTIFDTGRH